MALVREISTLPLPFRVEVKSGERSVDQNALSHRWYAQIWTQGRELNTVQARRFCKLHFGVPIMRANDDTFRSGWDRLIKPLPYETKLEIMDWWPVTSLMSTTEMREYLTMMQTHFGPKGVILEGLNKGYDENCREAQRA